MNLSVSVSLCFSVCLSVCVCSAPATGRVPANDPPLEDAGLYGLRFMGYGLRLEIDLLGAGKRLPLEDDAVGSGRRQWLHIPLWPASCQAPSAAWHASFAVDTYPQVGDEVWGVRVRGLG